MRSIKYILLFCLAISFMGCSEDELNPTSIFQDSKVEQNDFDKWLKKNYTDVYNIKFNYKYEDIESDMDHNLIPSDYTKSIVMAKLVKYLWLDAYAEVNKDVDPTFMKNFAPRVMQLIGSAAWEDDNTRVLGQAEGGLKITLYEINDINPENVDVDKMNDLWFHTIHHEFGHILQQTKPYSTEFAEVSAGEYTSSGWNTVKNLDALHLGFISSYASMEFNEDFVEILSLYVVNSDEWWQNQLALAKEQKVSKADFDSYTETDGVKELRTVDGPEETEYYIILEGSTVETKVTKDVYDAYTGSGEKKTKEVVTKINEYYIVYNGDKKILAKWQIIADYLKKSWGFTIEDLHKVVRRRESEISSLDLTSLTD